MMSVRPPNKFLNRFAILFAIASVVVSLCNSAKAGDASTFLVAQLTPTPTPSYLPWYTASPTPIPSAYVSIGAAFGARNLYNTSPVPNDLPAGNPMVDTGRCGFICAGAPGSQSHHVIIYGNDVDPGPPGTSDTHNGAPDDCNINVPPLPILKCPGGVTNQAFSVTTDGITGVPYPMSVDGNGNLGVLANLYAASATIGGSGIGTPAPVPSPTIGSLVSHTGAGSGDILLGSTSSFVKCDYGETTSGTLTCNQPLVVSNGTTSAGLNLSGSLWAMGGVQPNSTSAGGSGGYVPEAFPAGLATPHPQILSGSCTIVGSGSCTFPNSFGFSGTTYTCTITAHGNVPKIGSYTKNSGTSITIYAGSGVGSSTFSYICIG